RLKTAFLAMIWFSMPIADPVAAENRGAVGRACCLPKPRRVKNPVLRRLTSTKKPALKTKS
ncbi:MAG: hypothetical protein AAFR05_05785, partial [Bacteroidota bacterium]